MKECLEAILPSIRQLFTATTLTAISTGFIAIFTLLLYNVANETNHTTQAIQRAYVNVGRIAPGVVIFESGVVTAIRVDIPWNNSGTTPALKTSSRIGWAVYPNELLPTAPVTINTQDLSIVAIGPKADTNTRANIPIGYLQRAMDGEHLYILGWTTYRDIFPSTPWRLTEFCWEIFNIVTDDITKPSRLQWTSSSCPGERACYDDQCHDYEQRIQERLDEDRARLTGLSGQ